MSDTNFTYRPNSPELIPEPQPAEQQPVPDRDLADSPATTQQEPTLPHSIPPNQLVNLLLASEETLRARVREQERELTEARRENLILQTQQEGYRMQAMLQQPRGPVPDRVGSQASVPVRVVSEAPAATLPAWASSPAFANITGRPATTGSSLDPVYPANVNSSLDDEQMTTLNEFASVQRVLYNNHGDVTVFHEREYPFPPSVQSHLGREHQPYIQSFRQVQDQAEQLRQLRRTQKGAGKGK